MIVVEQGWLVEQEQNLKYMFRYLSDYNPVPVIGSNNLTVYFADNFLYMTEECQQLDSEELNDMNGNPVHLSAKLLYQLEVKGN